MSEKFGIRQVVRHINRGGMGTVDEVELLDGTLAARKTFEPDKSLYSTNAELLKLRQRFEREVSYQEQLGQTGAMPILHHEMKAEPPWFVMPLADKTYEQQIKEDRATKRIGCGSFATAET